MNCTQADAPAAHKVPEKVSSGRVENFVSLLLT